MKAKQLFLVDTLDIDIRLAVLWTFWNFPAFFYRDTYVGMGFWGFPMFLVSLIIATTVFTWLHTSTDGSLLLVILVHAFCNWLTVSEAGGPSLSIMISMPIIT